MKVLLINPPLRQKELFRRGSTETGSKLPPLGLAYLGGVLEKEGHEVKIIDGMIEFIPAKDIVDIAKNFDVVGITTLSSFVLRSYQVAKLIKEKCKKTIIMGGAHVSACPLEAIEKDYIDYVLVGESEYTLRDLVNALEKKKYNSLKKIKGMYYKKNNKIIFTGPRELIQNLDELVPARHLLPMDKYKSSISRTGSPDEKSFSIITGRGCPFRCTFCSKDIFGYKIRQISTPKVIEEIKHLIKEYNAKEITIWDDTFTIKREYVIEFCNALIKENINIKWNCNARVDCIDFELLKLMKKSSCTHIIYGIESGNEKILKSIRKGVTKDRIMKAIRLTKKSGIGVRTCFILGLVGDTIETMNDTINFAIELDADVATFTLFAPLPNTSAYENALKEGTFDPEYWKNRLFPEFNFLDKPFYIPKGITEKQLIKIHKRAYRKFYYRPSFIIKQILSINSIRDLGKFWAGFKTVLKA